MIESKNEIDSLIYSTEKSLRDVKEVEKAIEDAKSVKDSDDLEELKSKTEYLSQTSMKMVHAIYEQQRGGAEWLPSVDADFEEMKDDGEKK